MRPGAPYGVCLCGCGQETPLLTQDFGLSGRKKGEPRLFVEGHSTPEAFQPWDDSDLLEDLSLGYELKPLPAERTKDLGLQDSDCWIWTRGLDTKGFPVVTVGLKTYGGNRWVWSMLREESIEGLILVHACRDRACINPDHMLPVTRAEASLIGRDVAAEARKGNPPRPRKSRKKRKRTTKEDKADAARKLAAEGKVRLATKPTDKEKVKDAVRLWHYKNNLGNLSAEDQAKLLAWVKEQGLE